MKRYAAIGILGSAVLSSVVGCEPEPTLVFGSTSSSGGSSSGGGGGSCESDRIDLVIAVDNSRGMAQKQFFLAEAIPTLLQGLTNPPCIDPKGMTAPVWPATPEAVCPAGLERIFAPRTDIHIGVISSSIGGHGSDSCPDSEAQSCSNVAANNTSNNDRGHLLDRKSACSGEKIPTYANKSFLAWDPKQAMSPPGEYVLDNGSGKGLAPTIKELVKGADALGCGYESQLESVYRFLADPEPYEKISVVDAKAIPEGIDAALLNQRREFLRPDSQLMVLMTSDENDCSTKEYGQFFYVNQLRLAGGVPFHMPRARQECATNPADPCCKSCGQSVGSCPPDPMCGANPSMPPTYNDAEDNINLRCWDQKRRFGIDFLYPIDRYVQAFTQTTVTNRAGEVVPNPIFTDLDPSDSISAIRSPSKVLVTGIVGVPWQNIARNSKDARKGYKNWEELNEPVAGYSSTWEIIAGKSDMYIAPKDPLMNESVSPRFGTSPITGVTLASPMSPLGNPINGNEYTTTDDLQYACVFELPAPLQKNCKDGSCECADPKNDNPLCATNPDGSGRTLLVRGRALPGLRQLNLLEQLGPQAVVGSACPAQISNAQVEDFGYVPTMLGMLEWVANHPCEK